jgi:signal peptidase
MLPTKNATRFVDVSSDLLSRGYGVRFRVAGSSMSPAICEGDRITVTPIARAALSPGHIVVYRRLDRLFAHRIVSVGERLVLRGDAATVCDPPVASSQILGEVIAVTGRRASALSRAMRLLRRAGSICAVRRLSRSNREQ